MLRRVLTSSYMAGVALAATAHGGLLAGVFLLAPAGPSGLGPNEDVFLVTLVDEPVPASVDMPEPASPPPEPLIAAPKKVEAPVVPAVEDPVAAALPAEVSSPAPAEDVPVEPPPDPGVEAPAGDQETGPAFLTIEPEPLARKRGTVSAETPAGSSGAASLSGDGKAMRDAYLRDVRLQLARHAPRGVRGAGNCEVEFRLSRAGEVVFVGIQSSSGSRLYDRRCLKAVTAAVPFPQAPDGAAETDLRFTIVMQQKR